MAAQGQGQPAGQGGRGPRSTPPNAVVCLEAASTVSKSRASIPLPTGWRTAQRAGGCWGGAVEG